MATKWKYATVPAEQRLEMLRKGDTSLYDEEIARTADVIKARSDAGLDVTEQMNWADKVSYNYNLAKAADMGIDAAKVAETGYAARLFPEVAGEPAPKEPVKKTAKAANEDYMQGVTSAYLEAVNSNLDAASRSYNSYITSVNNDYNKKRQQLFEAYREAEKYYDELLKNKGHSAYGGRSMTERLKSAEQLYNALAELDNVRNTAVTEAKNKYDQQMAQMRQAAMTGLSNEQYRYYQLMADKEQLDYSKQRDAAADEKWAKEFEHKALMDKIGFAFDRSKFEHEAEMDNKNLELDKEQFDYKAEEDAKDRQFKQQQALQQYNMWLAEQEAQKQYNDSKLELDREKFEHQLIMDGAVDSPLREQQNVPTGITPYIPPAALYDYSAVGGHIPTVGYKEPEKEPENKPAATVEKTSKPKEKTEPQTTDDDSNVNSKGIFGKEYVNYSVMVKNVLSSGAQLDLKDVEKWIDGFELTDKEKTKIKKDAGIVS